MSKTNWKHYEKSVADYFEGERISKGKLGEEVPDVETSTLIIECKTRKNVPKWFMEFLDQIEKHVDDYDNKIPVVVLHKDHQRLPNDFVILRAKEFKRLLNELQTTDKALERTIQQIRDLIC